jgi:hypothetical protein
MNKRRIGDIIIRRRCAVAQVRDNQTMRKKYKMEHGHNLDT